MNAIELKSQKTRYLISLDKSSFDRKSLVSILEMIRIELLAKRVDFDKSIEDFGEEVKHQWWKKNKKKFLQRSE